MVFVQTPVAPADGDTVSGLRVPLQEGFWETLNNVKKQTKFDRRFLCRNKGDMLLYGKRYKIIVGSATDIKDYLLYCGGSLF